MAQDALVSSKATGDEMHLQEGVTARICQLCLQDRSAPSAPARLTSAPFSQEFTAFKPSLWPPRVVVETLGKRHPFFLQVSCALPCHADLFKMLMCGQEAGEVGKEGKNIPFLLQPRSAGR